MKIDQTFKNIKRLQQIGTVLATHGFQGVMTKLGLDGLIKFQKVSGEHGGLSMPERLRLAFEELGTTFVKLGQMLSIRPDLIPRDFVEEFKKLQDQVPPFGIEGVRRQIEKELEVTVEEAFAEFDPEPVGAASIAQAHKAVLADGGEVVVKVRRPGIHRQIETDLSILFSLANLLDRSFAQSAVINPLAIVDEFANVIRFELDFMREAQNIERFHRDFEGDGRVVIPEVVWGLTGRRVLTMGYIDGIPLKNVKELEEKGWDLRKLADVGMQTFLDMVFKHGFFHGDIHGGNILVLGEEKIGLIDFGIAGQLDERLLEDVASLLISLVSKDFRNAARHYLRISSSGQSSVSADAFARDIRRVIEPLMGLSLKQVNSPELLMNLAQIAQRHRLQVPQELLLLFRAIVTLDAIGRELDPDFDVLDSAGKFARTIIVNRYRPERLAVDLLTVLRDLADLGRDMPAQVKTILARAEDGGIGVDVRLRDRVALESLRREGLRIAGAVMLAGGGVTLAIVHASEDFGISGLIGLGLLIAGAAGLILTSRFMEKRR